MANEQQYDKNLTLDEIVFQNRNKAYGAYNLRTTYPKVLTKAFVFGTALFIVAASTPFIMMKLKELTASEKVEVKANMIEIAPEDPILEQPKEEEPPPPPPPPKEEPPQQEVIQNVVPEPVKAPKVETPPPPISKQLETTTGLVAQEGVKNPTYTPPPPPPSTGATKTMEVKPQVSTTEIYNSVDQSAEYPGGLGAVRNFLQDNFDTSAVDGEGRLSAKLRFVVERDGTVSDVRVVEKSGNSDFDAEAVRAVKKLKRWKPAKVQGETVRSYYSVPFAMQFE